MSCQNSQDVPGVAVIGGTKAEVQMHHCDDTGYVSFKVTFAHRNLGRRVRVKGSLTKKNQKGPCWESPTVDFCDDGRVIGYGGTADDVRFQPHHHVFRSKHTGKVDCYFLDF